MVTVTSASELAAHLVFELDRALSAVLTDRPIDLNAPDGWLLNTPLKLTSRSSSIPWTDLVQAFVQAAKHTSVICSYWEDATESVLHINAGHEVFRNVRSDRGLGSRMHSAVFNEAFASPKRLQRVMISQAPGKYTSSHLSTVDNNLRQLQANYLRFSLRLSAIDTLTVLDSVSHLPWHELSTSLASDIVKAAPESDRPLLQVALPVLTLPMELGCTTELDQAMNDMNSLLKLTSAKPILFAVKTQLAERYGVLMHFNGGSAQSMTRDLAPSYFVNWPDELQATQTTALSSQSSTHQARRTLG
ncbi:hypothetical protein LTR65_003681 [Meristemomyces frigidus]